MKESYNNNKLKISGPTWNKIFELSDGLYSISAIQGYFKYIIKEYETVSDNSPIKTFVNKIDSRVTLKIKTGYYLEFLTTETVKLLGSTKSKIIKNKNVENVPHIEITEVFLVHSNIINNDYQHDSSVLCAFVPSKFLGQLLDNSPKNFIFLRTLIQNFIILKYGLLIKILNR